MPHQIVHDELFVHLTNMSRLEDSNFFFDMDRDPANEREERSSRPHLRSLVSKAFITSCKDRTIYRARSFPFLKVSQDKLALLDGDDVRPSLNFEEESETTTDLASDSSITHPFTIPMEQKRLKKQLKEWKTRMIVSVKGIVEKRQRQYKNMPDDLFGGIEVPLQEHQLMLCWNDVYRTAEERDEVATPRNEGSTVWPSIHPPNMVDFAHYSPSMSTMSENAGSHQIKEPAMTVCYDDQCAQLVFGNEPPPELIEEEEIEEGPFDEQVEVFCDSAELSSQSSTSTDDCDSQLMQSQNSLGVSFSHPSWLQRREAEKKDEYGELWETLGDPNMDGNVVRPPSQRCSRAFSAAHNGMENVDKAGESGTCFPSPSRSPRTYASLEDHPFDEVDGLVRSDPQGNDLGVEVTARFSQDLMESPSYEEEEEAPKRRKLATNNRPVCSCVKCTASSIYADLYPNGSSE